MKIVKIIFVLVLTAVAAVFVYQNTEFVQLTFLAWSVAMSASLLVVAVFTAGLLAGIVFMLLNSRRKRARAKAKNIQQNHCA
jgi:uncharacterized integral membrane protein